MLPVLDPGFLKVGPLFTRQRHGCREKARDVRAKSESDKRMPKRDHHPSVWYCTPIRSIVIYPYRFLLLVNMPSIGKAAVQGRLIAARHEQQQTLNRLLR